MARHTISKALGVEVIEYDDNSRDAWSMLCGRGQMVAAAVPSRSQRPEPHACREWVEVVDAVRQGIQVGGPDSVVEGVVPFTVDLRELEARLGSFLLMTRRNLRRVSGQSQAGT